MTEANVTFQMENAIHKVSLDIYIQPYSAALEFSTRPHTIPSVKAEWQSRNGRVPKVR